MKAEDEALRFDELEEQVRKEARECELCNGWDVHEAASEIAGDLIPVEFGGRVYLSERLYQAAYEELEKREGEETDDSEG